MEITSCELRAARCELRAASCELRADNCEVKKLLRTHIVVQLILNSDKLHLCDFIDQTIKGSFELLPASEIAQLRQRLVDIIGVAPPTEGRPSDEQISAMAQRVRAQANGRMNPPWVEFAIFGPHGFRTAKMRQLAAHVLTRDGTWSQKTLMGSFVLIDGK